MLPLKQANSQYIVNKQGVGAATIVHAAPLTVERVAVLKKSDDKIESN